MTTLLIPDLSHYEPEVDFHAVKAGGVPAVITKATEGTGYTDPTYHDFMARGRSVGLIMGGYVFLDPGQATPQIEHFLSAAHLQKGDLQPIVDAEKVGLTAAQLTSAMHALEGKGYKPILYASLAFWKDVLGAPKHWPLWLAAYRAKKPRLPTGVTLFAWQFTDAGRCPGVAKPCDCSRFYGTVEQLKKYTI